MAEIDVAPTGDHGFRVTVTESGSSTTHAVTADPADVERLGEGAAPEDLVEASFRFLLDREPKESIMQNFDLTVIPRYFPDYPDEIKAYL